MPSQGRHCSTLGITNTIAANGGNDVAESANTKSLTTTKENSLLVTDPQAFVKLVRKAEKGDAKALAEVRAICKADPEVWDAISTDIARAIRDTLLRRLTGENELMHDSVNRQLARMKRDLMGTDPSPLERLLAERICACWLQVQHAEWLYTAKLKEGMSFAHGDYLQRQIDRANQRYTAAIRALAQVRRLLVPVIQVNVVGKQVNLATSQVAVVSAGGESEAAVLSDSIGA